MQKVTTEQGTFIVRVLNTQNATWQGTVTWTDEQRTESFRSVLELIRLIGSTLPEQDERRIPPGGGRGMAKPC